MTISKKPLLPEQPLPCPFCGGEPRVHWNGGMTIKCTNQDCCIVRTEWWIDVKKCVAQWNRRMPNVELTAPKASGLNERLCLMTPDTMQDLINWLCSHEDDIKHGINDFGELQQVFLEVVGRNAGEIVEAEPMW